VVVEEEEEVVMEKKKIDVSRVEALIPFRICVMLPASTSVALVVYIAKNELQVITNLTFTIQRAYNPRNVRDSSL
jgi:hypothetical protein